MKILEPGDHMHMEWTRSSVAETQSYLRTHKTYKHPREFGNV